MSMVDDLDFRPLEQKEMALADGLLATADVQDLRSECWGVASGKAPAGAAWGLFLRGALVGAAWLSPPRGGEAEIGGFLLPRGRWGMGLLVYAAGKLAEEAKRQGATALVVNLPVCGRNLGEELEFALFQAPANDQEDDLTGKWLRAL